MKKPEKRGLEEWMPPEGCPHIYAYSNLLRNGVTEEDARKTIEDQLIECGLATEEDFKDGK